MPDTAVVALSILVADDEEGIRNLLRHWLHSHGHTVVSVESAHEAVRLLRVHAFDLVITDVVMPDGDGFELIAAFRKAQPQARIVAISGGGKYLQGPDCLKIARGLGAHAAVMKPFNWEQLNVGIDTALLAEDTEASCSSKTSAA
jgi:DNA-binding NtrC family response regulator